MPILSYFSSPATRKKHETNNSEAVLPWAIHSKNILFEVHDLSSGSIRILANPTIRVESERSPLTWVFPTGEGSELPKGSVFRENNHYVVFAGARLVKKCFSDKTWVCFEFTSPFHFHLPFFPCSLFFRASPDPLHHAPWTYKSHSSYSICMYYLQATPQTLVKLRY